jgi:hypothetical protein
MKNVIKYSLFESKKYRKYNDILRSLGVMDDSGNIKLQDMTEKIENFLTVNDNKNKFLKDFEKDVKKKVNVDSIKVKVKDLKPSQTEIFLDHVLSRIVVKDKDREDILDGELKDDDILISKDGHIIDGHHRWASAFILNPDCELKCTEITLPIEYALPLINAIIEASDNENDDEIIDYDINIFKAVEWNKMKLFKKMNSIIENAIKKGVDLGKNKNKKSEEFSETNESLNYINNEVTKPFYKQIKKKLDLEKHPLKYIRKNVKKIQKPKNIFTGREEMPQLKEKDAKELL